MCKSSAVTPGACATIFAFIQSTTAKDLKSQLRSLHGEVDQKQAAKQDLDAVCAGKARCCDVVSGLVSRAWSRAVCPCLQAVDQLVAARTEASSLFEEAKAVRHHHDDYEALRVEVFNGCLQLRVSAERRSDTLT